MSPRILSRASSSASRDPAGFLFHHYSSVIQCGHQYFLWNNTAARNTEQKIGTGRTHVVRPRRNFPDGGQSKGRMVSVASGHTFEPLGSARSRGRIEGTSDGRCPRRSRARGEFDAPAHPYIPLNMHMERRHSCRRLEFIPPWGTDCPGIQHHIDNAVPGCQAGKS